MIKVLPELRLVMNELIGHIFCLLNLVDTNIKERHKAIQKGEKKEKLILILLISKQL